MSTDLGQRCYRDLRRLTTFQERYTYLRLGGSVGRATFGFDRYLNQAFYRSTEWRRARDEVIVRDEGCDLGIPDFPIHDRVFVHHMNPLTADDVEHSADWILDPEFLICVTETTHNAIHYGDSNYDRSDYQPRRPGDTTLW